MLDSIRLLFSLFSPREKRGAFVLLGLQIVGALFEVVGVGAVPAFVAALASPAAVLANDRVGPLLARLGLTTQQELAVWGGIALVVLFVVKNSYLAVLAFLQSRYTENRQAALSVRLFRHYLHSPYPLHLQRNSSELLQNTSHEVSAIVGGVMVPVLSILLEVLVLVLVVGMLLAVEPVLSVALVIVLGGVTSAFYAVVRRKTDWYAREVQQHRTSALKAVNQGLAGIKDVKVLGREAYFAASYNESVWFLAGANKFRTVVSALPRLFLEVVVVTGVLVTAVVLMAQNRETGSVIAVLALLAVAAIRLMPSFQKIMSNQQSLQWGIVSLRRVAADLAAEAETTVEVEDEPLDGVEVRFEDVTFGYAGAAEPALDGVSLVIPERSSVAFVGQSGAGKTTLVDVLLGLLEPTAGRVCVGGKDLARAGVAQAWRRRVGYIPQAIYLTDDTIRRNVAFGVPDDAIDDAAVWRALDAAQLRTFVEALPDGLATRVGDRGTRVSGGQRQRVGIARALYHRPAVLVMDEATSALDTQTERDFVDALDALQGEHTVVVIAHRLSTVRHCDRLFLLDHGRLAASGTYDELIDASPIFRAMASDGPHLADKQDDGVVTAALGGTGDGGAPQAPLTSRFAE